MYCCVPQYNNNYGVTCDYTFPQTTHSYVIVNDFNNAFGKSFRHHIVVTPECGLYTPCSTQELISNNISIPKQQITVKHIIKITELISLQGTKYYDLPNKIKFTKEYNMASFKYSSCKN